ncbi:MAG: hypothetical protein WD875_11725 [Pirellulales bacterium]
MRDVLLALIVVVMMGCGRAAPDPRMRELLGKTEPQLIERMGPPDFKNTLAGGKWGDEMRGGVRELLQKRGLPDTTEVLEYQWRSGEYNYAAWMLRENGEWVTVDAVSWHKSEQF